RMRAGDWGARTLDLDLIGFDSLILNNSELTIPHPRMTVRRFVIDPLAEIAADWVHPQLGWPVKKIRDHLLNAPRIVSLGSSAADFLSNNNFSTKIRKFEQSNPEWKFLECTDHAVFELAYMRDFECEQRWLFPRFHPTKDLPEVLLEQCFATCRGLSDLP
ncbi:MAG: 2-amino-4-hydroxy-6-hydroxymethyldihydropteridine diphosphokinase, partial [bacterium]